MSPGKWTPQNTRERPKSDAARKYATPAFRLLSQTLMASENPTVAALLGREESVEAALASVSRPVLTNAFGLAIGLSILFFSPLRIHMQVASVMWVAMMVSSLAALLLIPILYTGMRSGKRKAKSTEQAV